METVSLVCSVCLVYLVCLVASVDQIDKIDFFDQIDRFRTQLRPLTYSRVKKTAHNMGERCAKP
jgi:hypothetical protein